MRIRALIAGAAVAAIATPVAFAATKEQGIDGAISPAKAGSTAKPRNATLSITLSTPAPPAGKQFATERAVVSLPKGLRYNGAKFPVCTPEKLQSGGPSACPAGSKVGSGDAEATALNGQINAKLTVTAFNASKGKKLLLLVQGSQPIQINSVIEGTLKSGKGGYGRILDVKLPPNLKSIAGAQPTLTRFHTKIRATRTVKGKKLGYVQSTSCPTGGWKFKADLTFTDGDTGTGTDVVRCSR